ncbi:MAG: glycosyl hydrolase family 18 protein [Actinomycetota bacterium]|nr:glycosyl hydrolase family 18 protein [Actinomycetota bacterium]
MRRLAIFAALLALASGLLGTPAHAEGPPPKRVVSGWLPYWMTSPSAPEGVTSAVQNADLFTDVSPFWYSATAKSGGGVQVRINPNFTNGAANIAWAMGQLKAAGLVVLPAIADGSGKGRMAATLADPAKRTAHVADLVALVTSNGFDGIDLDYETFAFSDGSSSWAATQPNWTAFVQELGAALHAQGKLLSVTIPPPCSSGGTCSATSGYWVYNIAGIAPSADRIRIMAYDYSVRGIGSLAPMPWVRAIVAYSASVRDPAMLQIGVATYGRAWTRLTSSGAYRLSGACPTDKGSSAYRSLTGMQSPSGSTIPELLTSVGATDAVEWDATAQEYNVYYDKLVQWTDSAGATQTCTAKRVLRFLGPQGVLARTQLVGEFGLSAAVYWTIGGEDRAQWPVIRAYGQSLAPAATDISATGVPSAVFGTPLAFTFTVTSLGVPLPGVPATLQFRRTGEKKWVDMQVLPTGADGVVAFTVTPDATGDWKVFVPGAGGRTEGESAPFTTQVIALVSATVVDAKVARGERIVVRARALPAQAGQSLVLQVQRGEKWKNVARAKANGKGRARLVVAAPRTAGRYAYRVIGVGTGPILSGASMEFIVRVK